MRRTLAALLVVAAPGLGCGAPQPAPEARPNVLLYVVDTLRADALGCYAGDPGRTPHVDALAREGIVFERAFATSSWTRPSMASLLTGLHPPVHGAERRRDALPASVTTLAERLHDAGYATALVTANPNAGAFFGFGRGFERVIELFEGGGGPVRGRELVADSDEVGRRASLWLLGARRPFFLVVHTIDPHAPYVPPGRFLPDSLQPLEARAAAADHPEGIRALYHGEVRFNDDSFGAIVRELRARDLLERTLVVFTADHGEELGEHGRRGHGDSLVDEALHVPLVLRLPGPGSGPVRDGRVASGVDVVPTVLDAVGLPVPDDLPGASLLASASPGAPALASLVTTTRDLRAARGARFKLVVDRASDDVALYDAARSERSRIAPDADPDARAAQRRLGAALGALDATANDAVAAEPGPGLRAALRALGYAD